jgi:hypothetical protein
MPTTRRHLAVAAAVPAAALLLAGCSQAAPSSGGSIAAPQAQSVRPAFGGAPGGGSQATGLSSVPGAPADTHGFADLGVNGQGAKSADTPTIPLGTPQGRIERSVTATFVVPHGGFLSAFDALIDRAVALGGFVLSSSTGPDQSGRVDSGSVTVRVPAARLNDMVTGTPRDWRISAIDYGSVDHTAETVDLQARLRAAVAHRDALQGLLAGTHDLAGITALEQQIAQVQQEVEQDQGALDAVNGKVDMATATLALHEQGAVAPPVPSPTPRLLGALRDGLGNAVAVLAAVVEGLLSALPLLVLVAVGAVAVWRLRLSGARPRAAAVVPRSE